MESAWMRTIPRNTGSTKKIKGGLCYLSRIEKSLKEQGFSVKRADKVDIKRILAVYFEQNVTTEKFEDFDGERWIILNE